MQGFFCWYFVERFYVVVTRILKTKIQMLHLITVKYFILPDNLQVKIIFKLCNLIKERSANN